MTIPNYSPSTPEDFTHSIDAIALDVDNLPEVSSETAPRVRDILARAGELAKRVESARKDAKEPHLEAGRQVDASFKPLIETLKDLKTRIEKPLSAWMRAEQERQRKEAEEARKAAEEAAAFQEAMADDEEMSGKVKEFADKRAADARLKAAQAEQSGRVQSEAGFARAAGLRTYRRAELADAKALVMHFARHPDVIDAAMKLANAAVRAAKGGPVDVPGITVVEEQKVA